MFEKAYVSFKWFIDGIRNYTKAGFMKNSKQFEDLNTLAIPSSLSVMITGANSGIGFSAAKQLVQYDNINLHLVCRNKDRGESAVEELKKYAKDSSKITLHILDIGNLNDVKNFTKKFISTKEKLNVNNAGILSVKYTPVGSSEYEESFAINIIGTKALCEGLIDLLEESSYIGRPRVITVTSGGAFTQELNYENPHLPQYQKNKFDGTDLYAQQKRQQITLTEYWSNKYENVNFMAMHPGWVNTPGVEKSLPTFYKYMKSRLRTPEQGADTILYLSIHPEVDKNTSGQLYFDRKPIDKYILSPKFDKNEAMKKYIQSLEKLQSQISYRAHIVLKLSKGKN